MAPKRRPTVTRCVMGVSTLAINPATFRKVPYEAMRDFAPITQAVFVPQPDDGASVGASRKR